MRTTRGALDHSGQRLGGTDRLHLLTEVPVLLVGGGRDPVIPVGHTVGAHDLLPLSRLEVFDDADHFPHVDLPDRLARTVQDLLTATRPDRAGTEVLRRRLRSAAPPEPALPTGRSARPGSRRGWPWAGTACTVGHVAPAPGDLLFGDSGGPPVPPPCSSGPVPAAEAAAAEAVTLDGPRPDAEAVCSCHTSSIAIPDGEITIIRVYGDIDLNTQAVLQSTLDGAVRRRPAHLVVDLAGVRFCSVGGLEVLVRAVDAPPPRYVLSGLAPRTERVLRMLGPPDALPARHASVRVAVLAALVHERDRHPDAVPAPRLAPPPAPWVWDGDDRFRGVDDDELTARARGDGGDGPDTDAYRELAGRHRTRIYRSTLRMLGGADHPEDIVEDVSFRLRAALRAFGAADPPDPR